jgi:hypothetical protein
MPDYFTDDLHRRPNSAPRKTLHTLINPNRLICPHLLLPATGLSHRSCCHVSIRLQTKNLLS